MIQIIPAIDLIGGRCVRLTEGDFGSVRAYDQSPVETARRFEDAGLERLHIVDLDGARSGRPVSLSVLREISAGTGLTIDFGGGIKTDDDIAAVFDAGASIASIGSVAVRSAESLDRWIGQYGADRILLGADVRDGNVSIDGWQTRTDLAVVPFLEKWIEKGIDRAFVTDISKDGGLAGAGIGIYREIVAALPGLELIASGGVASMADIFELDEIGCSGVIVGKALYEGCISLEELTAYVG